MILRDELISSPDFVDWSDPVDWSHPLNRDLLTWYLAAPDGCGFGSYTWRDLTRRYDGTLTNMDPDTAWVGSARPGGFGAIETDGGATTVDHVAVAEFPFLSAPFTLSLWALSPETGTPKYNNCVSRGAVFESNTNFAFGTRRDVQGVQCYWGNSGAYGGEGGYFSVTTNEWNYLVAVIESNWDLKLYVNGILKATDTGNSAPSDGSQPLTIGSGNTHTGNDLGYMGLISDVRIHSRALSAEDVRGYYDLSRQHYPGLLNRIQEPRYVATEVSSGTILPLMNHYIAG